MNTTAFVKNIYRKLIGIVPTAVLAFLFVAPAYASDGAGAAGAIYLRLPVSAKSIAMGEVTAALPGDPFGWLYNPGVKGGPSRMGAGIFHSQWVMDTYYDNACFNRQVGGMFDLRMAMTYMSAPEVEGYDIAGLPTGPLKNNNFQGILGLGYSPTDRIGLGVNVKYIQEKIADWTAQGVAFDFGVSAELPVDGVSVGVTARNIGPKITFITHEEELPLAVSGGGAWNRVIDPGQRIGLTLAAEAVFPQHEDAYAAFGAELSAREVLFLRAGYNAEPDREADGFTAGGGVKIMKRAMLDYAWTPYGDLGNFHRISVYFALGN